MSEIKTTIFAGLQMRRRLFWVFIFLFREKLSKLAFFPVTIYRFRRFEPLGNIEKFVDDYRFVFSFDAYVVEFTNQNSVFYQTVGKLADNDIGLVLLVRPLETGAEIYIVPHEGIIHPA